jgi:hypothetical protein
VYSATFTQQFVISLDRWKSIIIHITMATAGFCFRYSSGIIYLVFGFQTSEFDKLAPVVLNKSHIVLDPVWIDFHHRKAGHVCISANNYLHYIQNERVQ